MEGQRLPRDSSAGSVFDFFNSKAKQKKPSPSWEIGDGSLHGHDTQPANTMVARW
jgi:hypothetical protein